MIKLKDELLSFVEEDTAEIVSQLRDFLDMNDEEIQGRVLNIEKDSDILKALITIQIDSYQYTVSLKYTYDKKTGGFFDVVPDVYDLAENIANNYRKKLREWPQN